MSAELMLLGEPLFTRDAAGRPVSRIATAFPRHDILVTLPGIHVMQRRAFQEWRAEQRVQQGLPPLGRPEQDLEWQGAVDLIVERDTVLIRPDPLAMPLAFQADEMLQRLLPKQRIHFLGVLNARVRDAIRQRGELWRITPLPRTPAEIRKLIESARIGIGGREIYYYGLATGVRYLTCQGFEELGLLDDEQLRVHLQEISDYAGRTNAAGYPELAFFPPGAGIPRSEIARRELSSLDPAGLRRAWESLRDMYIARVKPELRRDDPENVEWRNRMAGALLGREDEQAAEEPLLGLSPEFFLQIEWLPGGRIEQGEIIFDPVMEQAAESTEPDLARLSDEKPRKFIFNFVREYGDLEHVNVGRIVSSLSRRPALRGRRDVYVAVLKQRQNPQEIVLIIRMQKQGVREYLDRGYGLLDAMIRAEEYTEYILDRRLGCRQLGMNLPLRVSARRISERYETREGGAFPIWIPYFEREYIRGTATDKLPARRFESEQFTRACGRLLGIAAASNIIVGRCDTRGIPLFDDGDEVMLFDDEGMPAGIVVTDHTGTFNDSASPLMEFAPAYALPVRRRATFLPDVEGFTDVYLGALEERFRHIQEDYRRRRKAFDTLFAHLPDQEQGSFAYRWKRVLSRMDETNAAELAALIRGNLPR
jgi:hypothetical protein